MSNAVKRSGLQSGSNRSRRMAGLLAGLLTGVLALALVGGCAGRGTNQAATVDNFSHLHGLAVDPTNPDAYWLATHDGLVRADEQGRWQKVGRVQFDLMGFSASPAEPEVFYSSGHPGPGMNMPNPLGVVVSRDGGLTWEPVSLAGEVDFHVMAVSGADPGLIYGWYGKLFRSQDQGKSWTTLEAAELVHQGQGPLGFSPHPTDRNQLLAATTAGLQWSADQGASWQILLPGVVTAAAYNPGAPSEILAYLLEGGPPGLEPGLVRSRDGGKSWEPAGFKAGKSDAVSQVAIHLQAPNVIYLTTFGQNVLRSRDGGASWQTLAREGKKAN